MAETPAPDRPSTQSNVSPWLKVPGHADVLTRTMRGGCATWAAAAQSSALRLPELASPAGWPFSKGSGNDSRLGSLDTPVLGGVERKEHLTGITLPPSGVLISGLSFPRLGPFPSVAAPNHRGKIQGFRHGPRTRDGLPSTASIAPSKAASDFSSTKRAPGVGRPQKFGRPFKLLRIARHVQTLPRGEESFANVSEVAGNSRIKMEGFAKPGERFQ
jgi:hypothetical protein